MKVPDCSELSIAETPAGRCTTKVPWERTKDCRFNMYRPIWAVPPIGVVSASRTLKNPFCFYLYFSWQTETDMVSKYLCDNNIPAKVSIKFLLYDS
ncbi:hypothetical protein B296_00020716 [Ensete ventricosum]|uniref:Uncharacterized protein n=1 Tax=Ensete ventricosum TaxID=4639 RepID=A0A426ZID8_ENSVE|nr:hypothetical protein B296_00020716 [Ensete ventricosum]